jgi:hypothetical protein
LIGKNLMGAKLNGANLSDANLSGSLLIGADFSDAELSGVNFAGAIWSTRTAFPASVRDAMVQRSTAIDPRKDDIATADAWRPLLIDELLSGEIIYGVDWQGPSAEARNVDGVIARR